MPLGIKFEDRDSVDRKVHYIKKNNNISHKHKKQPKLSSHRKPFKKEGHNIPWSKEHAIMYGKTKYAMYLRKKAQKWVRN